MSLCPYCGNENPDTNNFCSSCGAKLMKPPVRPEKEEDPALMPEAETAGSIQKPEAEEPAADPAEAAVTNAAEGPHFDEHAADQPPIPPYADTAYSGGQQPPEKLPIGGYIAWAVFNILFCTIPGAIGLYYVLRINKAATVEDQLKAKDSAKKALMIGTVLAVLNLLVQITTNMN